MSCKHLTEKVYPALGKEILKVVGYGLLKVLEGIGGAANPAAPGDLPSGPDQAQISVTFGTFHSVVSAQVLVPILFENSSNKAL